MAEDIRDQAELVITSPGSGRRWSGAEILQRAQAADILQNMGLSGRNALILTGLVSARKSEFGDDRLKLGSDELS